MTRPHLREQAASLPHEAGDPTTAGARGGIDESPADSSRPLCPEQASRMAVTAVTSDVEFWARCNSVDGRVGVNDLIRTLDVIREASIPET
jgi:hypothetical protein